MSVKWMCVYQHTSRKRDKNSFYWRSGAEDEQETEDLIAKSGKEINGSELSVTNKMKYTHLDVVFMANFGDGWEKLGAQKLELQQRIESERFYEAERWMCGREERVMEVRGANEALNY